MKEIGAIILNPFCSNNCLFCGQSPRKSNEEMQAQERKSLKNLADFRKQGVRRIEISGGDPIEHDGIIRLINVIKKMGYKHVRLSTHGRRLADYSFADKIINSGLTSLRIPLYGSNASIHNSVTRADRSFEETVNGIEYISRNSSIDIRISCLIVDQNKDDIINIINLVDSLKIRSFTVSIPCVDEGEHPFYVPIKNLGSYVRKIDRFAKKINRPVDFSEIPFCVFGKVDKKINNMILPPDLGRHCQPLKKFESGVKDMPSYRLKTKVHICKDCWATDICHGFFVNDIAKFGTGDLKAIGKGPRR